jgi:VIT1/CCC1 family predicted Fe2+/Mn2+ transporter
MADTATQHGPVPHPGGVSSRLNWLRAGVLGANDGIISTAGLVVGVAAASASGDALATAGVAGVVAGAVSMALGEFVSVSSQRDAEKALVEQEQRELTTQPEAELEELRDLLVERGLSTETSLAVAQELTGRNALAAHLEFELGIDPDELANPFAAAFSSAVSFVIGGLIPLIAVLTASPSLRIPVVFVAVLVALALAGAISAQLGGARKLRAIVRLVCGGALAMLVTYGIGELLDVTVT